MGTHVSIRHRTEYRFDHSVVIHPHLLRLRPAPHCRTPILAYSLSVEPGDHFLHWYQDPFANYQGRLVFPKPARTLSVDVEVIVDLTVLDPFDFFVEEYAERWPFSYAPALAQELAPYREHANAGPLLTTYLHRISKDSQSTVDFLVALNRNLQKAIGYSVRLEPGIQACEETLERQLGSCRDTAWLLVELLRHLGFASRFVSGYLVQLAADEIPLHGPAGPAEDFTDLHAWAEVYLPGAGWLGLDPTSGLFAGEGHIPLACTPQPRAAAPIVGSTEPCTVAFSFENTVTRILEHPKVSKPYTDREWSHIIELGERIDGRLAAGDVRLTMGGEPTFVSSENPEAPEWNLEALGVEKLQKGEELISLLQERFAPGALLHVAQGKWYPGEALPRWALGLYWRKDGIALWQDHSLLAIAGTDQGRTLADAESFLTLLARRLQIPVHFIQPAYEDALYYLYRESMLPDNLDLELQNLADCSERTALAEKLSKDLRLPTGYVLPIAWDAKRSGWYSGTWTFRRSRLTLLPGDSPLGLRLPLDALPWVDPKERDMVAENDPFAPIGALSDPRDGDISKTTTPVVHEHGRDRSPHPVPHTALTVEVRAGGLYIFLPPLEDLEPAIALLAAIEATASDLHMAIVLEGYAPPTDQRLEKLLVTPDPGVIEVNIHPARTWSELVTSVEGVYAAAKQSHLVAEKFQIDGRHTGTGGGSHITLGGTTPLDSPFLRRPDLLQSLITYWQHHPALSYFFSGLFVGPTSQAPRIDEARHEALYELEIAFAHTPIGEIPQPWLVDRLFRNLLVDVSGNTHRTEICIDKLYSPDGPAGRQGLVELRAFEMPPHARLHLVQQLLVRALIVRFWEAPYRHPLIRWGTMLLDRFTLPHYLWEDLKEIVADLCAHDLPIACEWFDPFLEFRFPLYGDVQIGDIGIELRAALEPWHVLGEQASAGGTTRYVDSSVERLQVRVIGLNTSRYVLACNGRRVPLRPTACSGEYVAAVRYRAWKPPSALHPTIPVHSPLVFELVDTWSRRSVGGCTYHVVHPAGRHYEHPPINAWEAESRRRARFTSTGHTHGASPVLWSGPARSSDGTSVEEGPRSFQRDCPPEEPNPDYPTVLDLRRQAPSHT